MKINVIGIGAQKCASTWLYGMLAEHPQATVSTAKELDFFSAFYDRGYFWYEQQFSQAISSKVIAEVSPSYLCDADAPARAYQYNPDMRIVLTIRHPVQRALSNHRHEVRVNQAVDGDWSFETGLKNNPMYLEQGYYAKYLQQWLDVFPPEQIHIVLMDDIKADGVKTVEALYQFLGLDSAFKSKDIGKRFNKSFVNKNQNLAQLKDRVYNASQQAPLSWLWQLAKLLGIRKLYRKANQQESNLAIPEPKQATLDELADLYHDDLMQLEALLGRPLDAWRQ